jgi:hypothetical protein
MRVGTPSPSARRSRLGVELDDELLAHRHVDVLAHRQLAHGDLELPFSPTLEPATARSRVSLLCWITIISGLRRQRHDVTLADAVAGDVHPATVHLDVPWLTNWRAWGRVAAQPARYTTLSSAARAIDGAGSRRSRPAAVGLFVERRNCFSSTP